MSPKPGLIIPIDKPVGWSSFQVVNKLKWHIKHSFGLKKFKIGHAGTLDPLASGLLLVCVGSATKRIDELQAGIKDYSGTMVLGATTPCFDLEQAIDAYYPVDSIDTDCIDTARQSFLGDIQQIPPVFSAVKVDGQRAYVSAREGVQADIAPKHVTIYSFDITAFRPAELPLSHTSSLPLTPSDSLPAPHASAPHLYRNPQGTVPEGLPQVDFRISCSKGTYIRSIARDFGQALHSGAFLSALRRERIGDYSVNQALAVDDIDTVITHDNPDYKPLVDL